MKWIMLTAWACAVGALMGLIGLPPLIAMFMIAIPFTWILLKDD